MKNYSYRPDDTAQRGNVRFKNLLLYANGFSIGCLFLFLLAGCSDNSKVVIHSIKELSKLATTELVLTKVVKFQDEKFYGDRQILCETTIFVKTGIDFSKLPDTSIVVNGKAITVTLPYPEIISFDMPAEKIKEVFAYSSLFRSDFSNKEKDIILQSGEKSVKEDLAKIDVFESAKKNTETFLRTWLTMYGFQNINITFALKPADNVDNISLQIEKIKLKK